MSKVKKAKKPRKQKNHNNYEDTDENDIKDEPFEDDDSYDPNPGSKPSKYKKKVKPELKCTECEFVTTKACHMKTHRQSVHGNLKCPHCDFVTYSGHGYKHHLKRHESLHTCKICNKEVPESNYELHEAICGADGKCPACNYETKSSTEVNRYTSLYAHYQYYHMKDKHQYKCDKCDKTFPAPSFLKQHEIKIHQKFKEHMCDSCGKAFAAKKELINHLDTTAKCNPSLKLKCDICDIDFPHLKLLINHSEKEHNCAPPNALLCPHCPKAFSGEAGLKFHIEVNHLKTKPKRIRNTTKSVCDLCGKSFANKPNLKEHVRTKHEMLTPFECDQCNKKFGYEVTLKTHILNVHNKKSCKICGQVICNAFWLRKHMAKNHNIVSEESIKCDFCEQFFETNGAKNNHMQKVHGETKTTV